MELRKDFGDGWLTKSAQDLVRIAVVFAGFDQAELVRRIATAPICGEFTNRATVLRIMGGMNAEANPTN